MVRGGRAEADETYIGGKAKNMHKDRRAAKIKGTGVVGKAIVMGLLATGDDETSDGVYVSLIYGQSPRDGDEEPYEAAASERG